MNDDRLKLDRLVTDLRRIRLSDRIQMVKREMNTYRVSLKVTVNGSKSNLAGSSFRVQHLTWRSDFLMSSVRLYRRNRWPGRIRHENGLFSAWKQFSDVHGWLKTRQAVWIGLILARHRCGHHLLHHLRGLDGIRTADGSQLVALNQTEFNSLVVAQWASVLWEFFQPQINSFGDFLRVACSVYPSTYRHWFPK